MVSTTEAGYNALTKAVKESLWLESIARELKIQNQVTSIHCDNQSVIQLSKNSVHHERTKRIDIKLHFVKEVVDRGLMTVVKISTEHNLADMIIKPLLSTEFFHYLNLIQLKGD